MKRILINVRLARFVGVTLLLALSFPLVLSSAQAQPTSFKADFNANVLPATLEESGPSPIYTGGNVTFPEPWNESRRYLRTKANYNTTNFIAEITVTVQSGYGGPGMGFFGVGSGVGDPNFYFEPRVPPTTYARISPYDWGDGFVEIVDSQQEHIEQIIEAAGDGTHRVRITWNHVTRNFTVAIQKNYSGGPFSPTATIGTVSQESFGDTNTRIFFGGAGYSVWDDLLVVVLSGTPGDKKCDKQSIATLVQQFGSIDRAALALGFASAADLQSVIQDFCAPQSQFTFHNIDYPGANRTRARGINNHGDIVGAYRPPGGTFHAMMIQKGKFIPVAPATILGTGWSDAFKINDRGDIIGWTIDDNGYTHGFLLRNGAVTILDFPGATNTYANGLNDSGMVAGDWDLYDANGNYISASSFLWNEGNFTEVKMPGAGDTGAIGINARGDLVGWWDTGPFATIGSGFIFSKGKDQFTSFDAPFPGVYATQPDDINSTGDIVGQYTDEITYLPHGFLKVGDAIASIDYPGAAYTTAWGINSAGQMVGNWYDSSGIGHGWLAEPGKKQKPSSLPKPLDLIGWWPGDGNANDIRGGSNGMLMNGTTFAPGLVKQAFSFDGVDDYVDVADMATLHAITTAVTVDAWINPQVPVYGEGWIFARRDPLISEGVALHIIGSGYLLTTLQTNVSSEFISVAPVITFGTWQHVAVTADTATGQVFLYLNGKAVDLQSIGSSPTISGNFANVSHLYIGQREDSDSIGEDPFWGCRYQGLIDEVQFYDRALSSSEIEAIYLAGIKQGK